MADVKPGYKTSEFIITIVTACAGIGVVAGLITQDMAGVLSENSQVIVGAVEKIVGAAIAIVPVFKYIWSRTVTKAEVIEVQEVE